METPYNTKLLMYISRTEKLNLETNLHQKIVGPVAVYSRPHSETETAGLNPRKSQNALTLNDGMISPVVNYVILIFKIYINKLLHAIIT